MISRFAIFNIFSSNKMYDCDNGLGDSSVNVKNWIYFHIISHQITYTSIKYNYQIVSTQMKQNNRKSQSKYFSQQFVGRESIKTLHCSTLINKTRSYNDHGVRCFFCELRFVQRNLKICPQKISCPICSRTWQWSNLRFVTVNWTTWNSSFWKLLFSADQVTEIVKLLFNFCTINCLKLVLQKIQSLTLDFIDFLHYYNVIAHILLQFFHFTVTPLITIS